MFLWSWAASSLPSYCRKEKFHRLCKASSTAGDHKEQLRLSTSRSAAHDFLQLLLAAAHMRSSYYYCTRCFFNLVFLDSSTQGERGEKK
jgi:hypothetical protein